eukprot:gene1853-3598_t
MPNAALIRYRIGVQYNGHAFTGWISSDTARFPDVQSSLIKALTKFVGKDNFSSFKGSSRTDQGVHALRNYFHVDILRRNHKTNIPLPPHEPEVVKKALNFYLHSPNIAITDCLVASPNFDARSGATARTYNYRILCRADNNPSLIPCIFEKRYAWIIDEELDVNLMQSAADLLVGKHDFSAFRNTGCIAPSPVKTIFNLNVDARVSNFDPFEISSGTSCNNNFESSYTNIYKQPCFKLITVRVTANSFLYRMVRNIVSNLVLVGRKGQTIDDFRQHIAVGDRGYLPPAPACGLFLVDVHYPSLDKLHKQPPIIGLLIVVGSVVHFNKFHSILDLYVIDLCTTQIDPDVREDHLLCLFPDKIKSNVNLFWLQEIDENGITPRFGVSNRGWLWERAWFGHAWTFSLLGERAYQFFEQVNNIVRLLYGTPDSSKISSTSLTPDYSHMTAESNLYQLQTKITHTIVAVIFFLFKILQHAEANLNYMDLGRQLTTYEFDSIRKVFAEDDDAKVKIGARSLRTQRGKSRVEKRAFKATSENYWGPKN